jgi:hypothetical protein
MFKTLSMPFMEKSQQQAIISDFSLKGWGAEKIQKARTNTLGSDGYSQAQISRRLAHFITSDIFCLDESRPGRRLSILGPLLEQFWEKFPFATALMITIHFNVSHFRS